MVTCRSARSGSPQLRALSVQPLHCSKCNENRPDENTWRCKKHAENARNMQHDAQNGMLEIKDDISNGQTFFFLYSLRRIEGRERDRSIDRGKGWNICTCQKLPQAVFAKTRPWEPPCLSGGIGGSAQFSQAQFSRPTLCRAEHAKLQNMRRIWADHNNQNCNAHLRSNWLWSHGSSCER